MSVINQVLNRLERRGVPIAPEQTMVCAVPHGRRRFAIAMSLLALALAAGIAAWQWVQAHKPEWAAVSAVLHRTIVQVPAPASAVAVAAACAIGAGEATPAEMPLPASRLSFELSSIPLPSSQRELKGGVTPIRVEKLAANPAPSAQRQGSAKVAPAKPATGSGMPPPVQTASPDAKARPDGGELPLKQVSPAQYADVEFRKAVALMQQGNIAGALAGYEAALRLDAGHHAARQAWVALLLEGKRGAEAERVLQDGLEVKTEHTGFAMLLARLQVERGAVEQAVATLEKTLPYADAQADYQAFLAALLQRQNRHKEAVAHYQVALQLAPDNGVWLMGYGISLQAMQRADDARNAFRRALESKTLSPVLQAFVQQKLKGL